MLATGGFIVWVPIMAMQYFSFSKLSTIVVDPDPYWFRIQSGLLIRIRIRNPDPDPGGQK